MPVDRKLLEILCCPVSKTPLTVLGQEKLDKLNSMINSGETLYVDGEKVKEPLQEGLITEDGKVIYPVQDDIPILLEEKGIGTTQFQGF
ncbi:Trm112 family protein [Pseudomonadota bacterium]